MSDVEPRGPGAVSHEEPYRVRFDEAGPDRLLRTSGLLRYAQDVAWVHSDALGFDRDWYEQRGIGWIVRAAELEVLEAIAAGTTVRVRTAIAGYRRVWARRRAEVRLPSGSLAAWVHTDWVLIDDRASPARIPKELEELFPRSPKPPSLIRVDLPVPPDHAMRRPVDVHPWDIDPNEHVNNATYVDWFEEAVAALGAEDSLALSRRPRRYRIEYVSAAGAGTPLSACTWRDGSAWSHRLSRPDGLVLLRGRLETDYAAVD